MASSPITSWEIHGETVETVSDFIFWAPKALQMVTAAMKLKDTCSLDANSRENGYRCVGWMNGNGFAAL